MQQLTIELEQGHLRGMAGMERSAASAERAVDGWVDLVIAKLSEFARSAKEAFTIEQARIAISGALPAPPDLRAFGGVTQKAIRTGVIARTGQMAPAASSNASLKPLYRCGEVGR